MASSFEENPIKTIAAIENAVTESCDLIIHELQEGDKQISPIAFCIVGEVLRRAGVQAIKEDVDIPQADKVDLNKIVNDMTDMYLNIVESKIKERSGSDTTAVWSPT